MKYSIKVNEVSREGSLKAIASVVIADSFKLNNISIVESPKTGALFVNMPTYKSAEKAEDGGIIYNDVFNPISSDFARELRENILDTYKTLNGQMAGNQLRAEFNAEKEVRMPEIHVRVTPYETPESNIKGLASIVLDNSVLIHNVKVFEGKNDKLFVAMPSFKTNQIDDQGKPVYQDICYPVTAKFREKLYEQILETYAQEKEKISGNRESIIGKLNEQKETADQMKADAPVKEHNREERDER